MLLAYTKITLKEAILATALPDAPELQQLLAEYFPAALVQQCSAEIPSHPLKREIVTRTACVNRLVNRMGTCFTMQIGDETGADAAQIATAWYAASELLNGGELARDRSTRSGDSCRSATIANGRPAHHAGKRGNASDSRR